VSTSMVAPKLMKGALVSASLPNPLSRIVVFQYNPDTLTRTLTASAVGNQPDRGEALRLKGPPAETIKLDLEIDATDQMEQGQGANGVYPALASIELMLYPSSVITIANAVLINLGVVEIIPAEAPLVFFLWGPKRVLPVRITTITVVEEMFDANLMPIHAKVSLELRVLSYYDLGLTHPGGAIYMANQILKEALAAVNGAGNVAPLITSSLGL
jgi:hypothetical protein